MFLFLLFGSILLDRRRAENGSGEKRRCSQIAAHLLGQHTGTDIAETTAAMCFLDDDSRPSHLGHFGPQFTTESVCRLSVANATECRYRCLFYQEPVCCILQHLLFFVEYQRHD